jgi:hypothetical protein
MTDELERKIEDLLVADSLSTHRAKSRTGRGVSAVLVDGSQSPDPRHHGVGTQ